MFKTNFFKRLLAIALCMLIVIAAVPEISLTANAATLEAVPEKDWTGYTPISTSKDLEKLREDPFGKFYLTKSLQYYKTSPTSAGWEPIGKGYVKIPEPIASQADFDIALEKYPAIYEYSLTDESYVVSEGYAEGREYFYFDAFYGILDGNGHSITQLNFDRYQENNYGFFRYNCGIITNLSVHGLMHGNNYGGMIASVNYGVIQNCYTSGIVGSSGDRYCAGGFCGENYGYIANCCNNARVDTRSIIGGIAGANFGTIRNCSNISSTNYGDEFVGGICGIAYNSVITECVNFSSMDFSSGVFPSTNGHIVGMDMSDEELTNFYRNCFYPYTYNANRPYDGYKIGVGNVMTWDLYGGPVASKPIGKDYGKVSLEAYLDFENEWYETTAVYKKVGPSIVLASPDVETTCAVWDGTAVKEFAYGYGSGTKNDPYLIRSARQLAYINKRVMAGETFENTYFKLIADVEINDTSVEYWYKRAVEWKPIGDAEHPFKGNFDGDGYTVKGVYFNRCYETGAGLFGYLGEGAEVCDVSVECYIVSYGDSGAVCGINDGGTIRNCNAYGYMDAYEGGAMICGYNNGKIISCKSGGKLSGYSMMAGICAYNTGEITECISSTEVVSCAYDVAGICAINDGVLTDCYNIGDMATISIAGGICAENYGEEISACYNTGSVFGSSYVGGICAYDNAETVESCYYMAGVAKDALETVQAGIGTGTTGENLPDITGKTVSLTADQMKKEDSFAGFDFGWSWTMAGDESYSYPELKRLIAPPTGDVNGDGSVNAIDANLLKRNIVDDSMEIDKYNADINEDRCLNAVDSNLIKRHIAGQT